MEIGFCVGVGDDGDLDSVFMNCRDGEADAFNTDRSLRDNIFRQRFGNFHHEPPVFTTFDFAQGEQLAYSIYVPLNDMAAQSVLWTRGKLKVYRGPLLQAAERGALQSFFSQIGRKLSTADIHRGKADAAHGNAIAQLELRRNTSGLDGDAGLASVRLHGGDLSGFLNESGKHQARSLAAGAIAVSGGGGS